MILVSTHLDLLEESGKSKNMLNIAINIFLRQGFIQSENKPSPLLSKFRGVAVDGPSVNSNKE